MSPRRTRKDSYDDLDDVAAAYRSMRRRRRPRRLYRDTERGMLGGVCAGLAKYSGVEPWIIRVAFIAVALLGLHLFALIAYIVLVIVLDKEPEYEDEWVEEDFERAKQSAYATVRASPKLGLRVVSADMRELELRLRRMEGYVTSPKYSLDKGFSDMAKH